MNGASSRATDIATNDRNDKMLYEANVAIYHTGNTSLYDTNIAS